MNELKIFENKEFGNVRVINKDNEPWFVGKDIADNLGYQNGSRDIERHVDLEDRRIDLINSSGQRRKMTIINESGLYSLIMSSKLESAKRFKRWVTSEILPSIRKHGAYMTPETIEKTLTNPDFIIKIAKRLKAEQYKNKALENKIEKNKPKIYFANEVANSNSTILVGEMAKLLNQLGIDTGQNRFYKWLRENGYVIKRRGHDNNVPTQKSMDLGIMRIKENTITRGDTTMITKTTMVTGKGQRYFIEKFRKMKEETNGQLQY
jgi:anti-repressor protein